jgi:hypothetical protein
LEKFIEKKLQAFKRFVRESPKKLFLIVFVPVLFLSGLNLLDFYVIPTQEISDEIIRHRNISHYNEGRSYATGYAYKTETGLTFTTSKSMLHQEVTIKHTRIFHSVCSVTSADYDYTNGLISNLSGGFKYFHIIYFFTLLIGVGMCSSKQKISKNTFMNIMVLNSLMLGVLLYFTLLN